MQIGEENQAFAEINVLAFDGLLDLDDHVGVAPRVTRVAHNLGAGVLVFGIGEAGLRAGLGFDQNCVTGLSERFHARGGDSDAGFVVLDFLGNADDHGFSSFAMAQTCLRAGRAAPEKLAPCPILFAPFAKRVGKQKPVLEPASFLVRRGRLPTEGNFTAQAASSVCKLCDKTAKWERNVSKTRP